MSLPPRVLLRAAVFGLWAACALQAKACVQDRAACSVTSSLGMCEHS